MIDQFRYRPEIDGFRAIAVLAVLFYHAGFGCTGGYVGVDVFFVISGFLITSLIWKDLETGRFTFAHFWERRARRIVPAIVVVTLAVLAAGGFLLLPEDFKNLGKASAAQAGFVANIHYWLDSGYFAREAAEKPLLHTWSLAVEEQFYLIVPFLFWGMFRSARLRSRTAVLSIVIAIFTLSFAASLVGVRRHPSATFYLLPTRAWELSLGSLVAFLPVSSSPSSRRRLREAVGLAGLILVLIPIFQYTHRTPFPGLAALPPCLGTALLIWSNGPARTWVGSVCATRPIVFIGLISYSLYLWHWPLLAYSRYASLFPLSAGLRLALLALGFLFAFLSWKFVETPFRTRQWGATLPSMYAYAVTGLALVFGCGLICAANRGFPQRFPAQALEFANAATDLAFTQELTVEDIRSGKLTPIGSLDPAQPPTVLVWGDSHAMAAMPAIDAFLKEKGVAGRAVTHSSTPPVLDWVFASEYGIQDPVAFGDSILDYIRNHHLRDVLLCANWKGYLGNERANDASFDSALLTTVRRLVALGAQPWILLEVPGHSFDIPKALSRNYSHLSRLDPLYAKPADHDELSAKFPNLTAELEAAGGRLLDPKPIFLDPSGHHYIIQTNGVALYRDKHHLTTKGAKLMLLPLLRDSAIAP